MVVEAEAQGVVVRRPKVGIEAAQVLAFGRGGAERSLFEALAHQGVRADGLGTGAAGARDAALRDLKQGRDLAVGEAAGAQAQAPDTALRLAIMEETARGGPVSYTHLR